LTRARRRPEEKSGREGVDDPSWSFEEAVRFEARDEPSGASPEVWVSERCGGGVR